MFSSILLAFATQGANAAPKMEIPDPNVVTTIEAAAEKCLLTSLNIDWEKHDEKTLKINLPGSLLKTEDGKKQAEFTFSVLKYCMFTWAHDRDVTVMFDGGERKKLD